MVLKKYIDRYTALSAPTKATIWFTICNFILKGISFITVPLFARLLASEEYGKLSVFTSYEQLLLILATWEIQLGAYQKGLFKYKQDQKFFTLSTQALVNILTIAFFVIVFAFNRLITGFTGMNNCILILLFIYYILQPSYTCWLTRMRTEYKYKPAVSVTLIYTLTNVFIPLITVLLIKNTANYKFGATLIGSSVFCLVFYLKNANYLQLRDNIERLKEHWRFLILFEGPVVLHSLSYLVLNQADRIMISKMVGNSEAAFYSVAYSIAIVISILQSSINQSLLPWRYQMLEARDYKKISKITNGLLFGFGILILLYILVAPEIVKILFTDDYSEAIWCIPPVTASIFFIFLYTIFVNVESYFEKTKYIMYVSVSCGIINIILNYFCINIFGYIACGYTTLASYVLFALGHYYFMKKILKENKIQEKVVDPKIILCISIAIILLSVFFALLYKAIVVRYCIFCIASLYIFIKRKKILTLIKTIREKSEG